VTTVQGGPISASVWHHVALVYDGAAVRLVVDGVEVASNAATGSVLAGTGRPVTIGALDDGTWTLDGQLDEVRIVSTARTVDWLAVEEGNQRDPASFLSVGAVETGTWLGQGQWSHRIPVVIDGSAFGATLTDQPVPVRLASDPDLAALALADGADIVVTDGDAVTRLDHEIERFDETTGELVAWVRVPQVEAGVDELLYLYVGNPTAVDQQDAEGVFDATTEGVWHLAGVG
jgi:hypothetical protein